MERGNAKLKFIDRYVGPLLLMLARPFVARAPVSLTSAPKSFGLLKTAAIGDTVLVSALISDIKAFDPSARIVLFVGSSNFEFAKLLKGIDEIELLPLSRPWQSLSLIRAHRLDIMIDADAWPRISALLAGLSRSRVKVGFKTAGQHREALFDRQVVHSNEVHELENYRALLRAIDIPGVSAPQDLSQPWTGGSGEIVFHLWPGGTKSYLKEWDFKYWLLLARGLAAIRPAARFALSGAPGDRVRNEALLTIMDSEMRGRFRNLAGKSFGETVQALKQSDLLISVNTGIMHVGAAMGVPTVGLHGPTNPRRWGPWGTRVRSVLSRDQGAGTLNLGSEYPDEINRMNGLSVDDVLNASRELLSESVL